MLSASIAGARSEGAGGGEVGPVEVVNDVLTEYALDPADPVARTCQKYFAGVTSAEAMTLVEVTLRSELTVVNVESVESWKRYPVAPADAVHENCIPEPGAISDKFAGMRFDGAGGGVAMTTLADGVVAVFPARSRARAATVWVPVSPLVFHE
jgi:hypothetical protein